MRHADRDFLHAVGGSTLGDLVERGDGCVPTFEAESFLPFKPRVEELLERFGFDQPLQSTQRVCWSSGHWFFVVSIRSRSQFFCSGTGMYMYSGAMLAEYV